MNANAETRAKAGNAYLDQFKTPQQTYNDDLSKAANARQNALLAPNLTTEERANIEAKYQRAAAVALQTYNSSLSAGAHGGGAGTPADPLSGLSSMVTGLSTKSIGVAGDQALTTYVQGVAKLLDEFDSATAKGANVTRATELYDQGLQSLNQTLNATRVAQAAADKAYGEQLDQQLATRRAAIAL